VVDSASAEPQAGDLPLPVLRTPSSGAHRTRADRARGGRQPTPTRAHGLRSRPATGRKAAHPRRVAKDASATAGHALSPDCAPTTPGQLRQVPAKPLTVCPGIRPGQQPPAKRRTGCSSIPLGAKPLWPWRKSKKPSPRARRPARSRPSATRAQRRCRLDAAATTSTTGQMTDPDEGLPLKVRSQSCSTSDSPAASAAGSPWSRSGESKRRRQSPAAASRKPAHRAGDVGGRPVLGHEARRACRPRGVGRDVAGARDEQHLRPRGQRLQTLADLRAGLGADEEVHECHVRVVTARQREGLGLRARAQAALHPPLLAEHDPEAPVHDVMVVDDEHVQRARVLGEVRRVGQGVRGGDRRQRPQGGLTVADGVVRRIRLSL